MRNIKAILLKIWVSPFFRAFLTVTISLVLALLFCDQKYAISDDFLIDGILSGAFYGQYNPHMLYTNVILGYFLVFLYSTFSRVSFFFVLQIVLGYTSIICISYLCYKYTTPIVGSILSILTIIFFSSDLFIMPTYTVVGSVAILAGGALLVYTLWNSQTLKENIVSYICSFFLIVVGSMLRFECVYLTVPFVVVMFFIRRSVVIEEKKTVSITIKKLLVCVLYLGVVFGSELLGSAINNSDPEYKDYFEYNDLRSYVTDYYFSSWEDYADELTDIGITSNDYDMIKHWQFVDRGIFTSDKLEAVADVLHERNNELFPPLYLIADNFAEYPYLTDWTIWACVILCVFLLVVDRKKHSLIANCFAVTLFMLIVTFLRDRCPYRVSYGIFLGFFILIISCFPKDIKLKKSVKIGSIVVTAILTTLYASVYIPDNSYKTMDYNEYILKADSIFSNAYDSDYRKYRFVITAADPYHNLVSKMEEDDEHIYLCSFYTTIQNVYFYYTPWERLPLNYWRDTYMYLGGCDMQYPDAIRCYEYNGIDPDFVFGSIVDNDEVYVVDNFLMPTYVTYYKENYDMDVNAELVDEVDGFYIWRYYSVDVSEIE